MTKGRVLGVDDNAQNLGILRKALGAEFDLATAGSGEEALEIARRRRPDVVLLDIMMPGIDGYETCRRMRACPELVGAKILLVSAKVLTSDRLEGYHAGADDYVAKPFDPYELQAKVRVYMRLRSVEEVDRLKTEVLSLLSHETRTPLAAILAPLALVLESSNLTDEQRRLLHIAEAGGSRLTALMEKGLLVARLRSGGVTLERESQDLERLAAAAVERAQPRADAAGLRLVLESCAPPAVEVDASRLGWVLDALLDNAIRFTPSGGAVTVRASRDGASAALTVSDEGPGVPDELRPRLFHEFVVGDVSHHSKGTGLSLAAAHAIAELHGGTLDLEPSSGVGAAFRLLLPAAADGLRAA